MNSVIVVAAFDLVTTTAQRRSEREAGLRELQLATVQVTITA